MSNYVAIRHLRGTEAEWAASDAVAKDGELALLYTDSGRTRIKVGNGTSPFSELPFIDGDVKNETPDEGVAAAEPLCGEDLRFGTCTSLSLAVPAEPDDDYYALVTFDSGEVATVFTDQSGICFTGDDTTEGTFLPVENKHYTVFVWYDGAMQGLIRGVAHA